jgi:hypothetical protein
MGIIDNLFRREKRDTQPSHRTRTRSISIMNALGVDVTAGRFNNESTWLDLVTLEPFIKGAVESLVSAINGEWALETTNLAPSQRERTFIGNVKKDITLPELKLVTKMNTAALSLITDTVVYAEIDPIGMNYYLLDSEDCEPIWNDDGSKIINVIWRKGTNQERVLEEENFVMGSYYAPDTKWFKASPVETLIDVANLLWYARKYNLEIFKNGGLPAMLFVLSPETSDEEFDEFVHGLQKSDRNVITRLPDGVQIEPLAGFNKEMEYDKLVTYAIQSIMTALRVTPTNMSLTTEHGGGSASAREERNSYSDAIHTYQRVLNGFYTEVIHKLYGNKDIDARFRPNATAVGRPQVDYATNIRFKYKPYMDMRQLAANIKILLSTNVITPNEARSMWGLEEKNDEVFDQPIGSNQFQAGGQIGDNPEGQDRITNEENDTIQSVDGDEGRRSQTQEVDP